MLLNVYSVPVEAAHLRAEQLADAPPELVLEQAKALGADLIAMGTHGRGAIDALLLGSTTARVLPWATCPVLTLRRQRR